MEFPGDFNAIFKVVFKIGNFDAFYECDGFFFLANEL